MEYKKIKIVLWGLIIVLFALYAYVYIANPLQKEFNLGLVGLIFSIVVIFLWIFLRNKKLRHEKTIIIAMALLIFYYLIIS